jgi:prepilin peptidase CpaA
MPQILVLVAVPALLAFAAASDLVSMTISNRVPLALGAGFVLAAVWMGLGPAEIGWHVAAGLLVLVIGFGLFSAGWIGGGDAKLAAAIALWLGFPHLFAWSIGSALLGALLTIAILKMRGTPMPTYFEKQEWIMRLHDPRSGVPYGIALSFAALAVLPHTMWFRALGS